MCSLVCKKRHCDLKICKRLEGFLLAGGWGAIVSSKDVIPLVAELKKEEYSGLLPYLKESHPQCSVGLGIRRTHLSTAIGWREKICKYYVFYKIFSSGIRSTYLNPEFQKIKFSSSF